MACQDHLQGKILPFLDAFWFSYVVRNQGIRDEEPRTYGETIIMRTNVQLHDCQTKIKQVYKMKLWKQFDDERIVRLHIKVEDWIAIFFLSESTYHVGFSDKLLKRRSLRSHATIINMLGVRKDCGYSILYTEIILQPYCTLFYFLAKTTVSS